MEERASPRNVDTGRSGADEPPCGPSRARTTSTFVPRSFLVSLIALLSLFPSGCGLVGYGAAASKPRVPVYYRVRQNDTVTEISRRFNVSADTILLLNSLSHNREIAVGQRLLLGYTSPEQAPELKRTGRFSPADAKIKRASVRSRQKLTDGWKNDGPLLFPVVGGELVSAFGPRGGGFHDGLDIAAAEGAEVRASHAGEVVYADDELSGYGKLVIIRGADGLATVYAHNSAFRVSTGDRVVRGQVIAEVGETGRASGPHLHYEVRTKDRHGRYAAVDPLPYLFRSAGNRPRYRVNESLTPILAGRTVD